MFRSVPSAGLVPSLFARVCLVYPCLPLQLGFNVLEAANGLEGVNVFEQQQQSSGPLAIIITDLQMPDADDGLLLTRAVRAMEVCAAVIWLLTSTNMMVCCIMACLFSATMGVALL